LTDRAVERGYGADFQRAAWGFGFVFLVVGIAGFVPDITTSYGDLTNFSSPGANAFGFIGVNIVGNVIYLLYAIAGFALSRTWDGARTYFLGGGLIFLVLWLYGLIIDLGSAANFLGLNSAANWVHLILGLLMLFIGAVWGRPYAPRSRIAV
jgi:hypothetical protein